VLLLIAICGAELLRTILRKRIDVPMLAAIGIGMASLAATLPYIKASSEFKKHYYAGPVPAHMLTQPYRQMLLDYTTYPHAIQHLLMLLLLLAAIIVLWRTFRAASRNDLSATTPEWAIVLLLVAMPLFAFILGRAVTHALEVRHSIGAIVGISTLIAIAMLPLLRRRDVFLGIMTAILLGIVVINSLRARNSAEDSRTTIASLTLSPDLKAQLDAMPDRNLYFQDLGEWEVASLYEPDADLRSRLVLVYSRPEEMQYEQHDTMFLTATHTQKFSTQPIVDYDALRRNPGEHTFVVFKSGWDWTADAFRDEDTKTVTIGPAFGGALLKVRF
jgi:Ca2+/Na+ antiporter